jgi:hypothetical protein
MTSSAGAAAASVEYDIVEGKRRDFPDADGCMYFLDDIVVVQCLRSGCEETAYGHGEPSVKAALAKLSQACACGSRWHYESVLK